MQYQVPQFIEAEDKIVGPLSLKQFLYLSGGAGVSMMFFFFVDIWLWAILSVFIFGFAAALALIKINGRPFGRVFLSAIAFYWQPQTYVWQPETPDLPKNKETVRSTSGLSLESIVAGMALRSAWEKVQVGSKASGDKATRTITRAKERYEIFHKITGDRQVAKRIDYR